jgi:hypothetical protein
MRQVKDPSTTIVHVLDLLLQLACHAAIKHWELLIRVDDDSRTTGDYLIRFFERYRQSDSKHSARMLRVTAPALLEVEKRKPGLLPQSFVRGIVLKLYDEPLNLEEHDRAITLDEWEVYAQMANDWTRWNCRKCAGERRSGGIPEHEEHDWEDYR